MQHPCNIGSGGARREAGTERPQGTAAPEITEVVDVTDHSAGENLFC